MGQEVKLNIHVCVDLYMDTQTHRVHQNQSLFPEARVAPPNPSFIQRFLARQFWKVEELSPSPSSLTPAIERDRKALGEACSHIQNGGKRNNLWNVSYLTNLSIHRHYVLQGLEVAQGLRVQAVLAEEPSPAPSAPVSHLPITCNSSFGGI